ncbi:MAG: GNAT family N-acetyltransferase [Polaromonas sp.]|nr:GNAT family N-acetyltransferase [Polaromonas sp.]
MIIRLDDLRGAEIADLLQEHLRGMHALSPPESVHALDIDALRQPDITFWSAWDGTTLCGCGALKQLNGQHGEVKSMRTAAGQLRSGVASKILQQIIEEAKKRGYHRLSLETGSMNCFEPAHALYARFDFKFCGPFGDYVVDPNSVFMTRDL